MSTILSEPGSRRRPGTSLKVRAAAWAPRLLFSLAACYAAIGLVAGWWPLGR